MIKVRVSANERLSGRTESMRDAISYFRRGEFSDVIEEDLPCDIIFEENGRIFAVEAKTLKDFHSSLNTNRFCSQLISFVEAGVPCVILVFGSYTELLNSIPDYDANGRRDPKQIAMIKRRIQDILCECYGMYIPILFLDKNPITSFIFLLKAAMKILMGGCAANMIPKPDKAMRPKAMLCLIDGVGEKTASAILREFGSLGKLSEGIKSNIDRLSRIKVGNRLISQETVKNVSAIFS